MGDTTELAIIDGAPTPDQFAAAEENDIRQIELDMEGRTLFDEHLFYRMAFKNKKTGEMVVGRPELSAVGVRALELVLSQRHRLVITEHSLTLEKYDPADRSTWMYEALVKIRNETTGHDSIGAATRPFQPDPKRFNRRSCLEIARLKAMKGQLPIKEINNYMMQVTDNGKDESKVKVFLGRDGDQEISETPPSKRDATADDLNELRKVANGAHPGTGDAEVARAREMKMSGAAVHARIAAIKSEAVK